MREDNKRQDMLIEELNNRLDCDVAKSSQTFEESRSSQCMISLFSKLFKWIPGTKYHFAVFKQNMSLSFA